LTAICVLCGAEFPLTYHPGGWCSRDFCSSKCAHEWSAMTRGKEKERERCKAIDDVVEKYIQGIKSGGRAPEQGIPCNR
jgi:hypothetical protein